MTWHDQISVAGLRSTRDQIRCMRYWEFVEWEVLSGIGEDYGTWHGLTKLVLAQWLKFVWHQRRMTWDIWGAMEWEASNW